MLERIVHKVANLYTHAVYAARSRLTAAKLPAHDAPLPAAPIPPHWIEEGTPEATAQVMSQSGDGGLVTGVWHCTAGRFKWQFFEDEIVHILDGSVEVEHEGKTMLLEPGSVVYFPIGSITRWTVKHHVRKLFVHRHPALYTKKIVNALV